MISIDKDPCGHFQKLAGVHSSKYLQFVQLSPYVPLDQPTKVALIIHWFSVASGSKGVYNQKVSHKCS
jgi:hypothetical protein